MPVLRLIFFTKLMFIHLSKPMIFLAKLMTQLITSWITMCTYFCISLLLHHYPLLIEPPISQNLFIFTPTTISIRYAATALKVGCSENHYPDFR